MLLVLFSAACETIHTIKIMKQAEQGASSGDESVKRLTGTDRWSQSEGATQTISRIVSFEELQHKIDKPMVRRLTNSNPKCLRETIKCACCGCNFARAFELQASFVRLFVRRDNYPPEERKFLIHGDLIAWTIASVGCDPATALEKLEEIRQTYRRLHLACNQRCSVCLHHPGYHSIRMIGADLQNRPVIFSSFDPEASLGLNSAGLPSYLTHLFYCIRENIRFLPATQHGVCLFFDCSNVGGELYTVDCVSAVAEMLKLLPCRIAYTILARLKHLHRRLLTPLLYLTGMEDHVIYLSVYLSRERMETKLKLLFPASLATWIAKRCVEVD